MANEITLNIPSITYVKDPYNDTQSPGILNLSVTGLHAVHDKQQLSATAAVLNKGNIGTIGFYMIKNRDATIAILFSMGTTDFATVPSGFIAIGYAGVANINAKGASGTPLCEYWFIEA
jgi:hypothetical protein